MYNIQQFFDFSKKNSLFRSCVGRCPVGYYSNAVRDLCHAVGVHRPAVHCIVLCRAVVKYGVVVGFILGFLASCCVCGYICVRRGF